MRFTRCGLILFFHIALAFASITVVDGRGKPITLAAYPKRIVSITPSNTEIIFALGLGDRLIGDTSQCDYPPQAKAVKNKVGDYNISVEKVISLKPDLVIAHSFLNPSAIAALERLKVPVFAGNPKSLEEVMDFIQRVGKITGAQHKAALVVAHMKRTIAQVKKLAQKSPAHPRVLFVVQKSPLWAAGSNTFADEMIRLTGGVNVASANPGFFQASSEAMIIKNPEYILASVSDANSYYSTPVWRSVSAIKNRKVFEINPDLYTRTGPRITDALMDMYRLLRK